MTALIGRIVFTKYSSATVPRASGQVHWRWPFLCLLGTRGPGVMNCRTCLTRLPGWEGRYSLLVPVKARRDHHRSHLDRNLTELQECHWILGEWGSVPQRGRGGVRNTRVLHRLELGGSGRSEREKLLTSAAEYEERRC